MSIFGKKHKLVLAKKIAITAPASLMATCRYPHQLCWTTSICQKSKKLNKNERLMHGPEIDQNPKCRVVHVVKVIMTQEGIRQRMTLDDKRGL